MMTTKINLVVLLFSLLSLTACQGQSSSEIGNTKTTEKMKQDIKNTTNPLLCDIETGMCEMPGDSASDTQANINQSSDEKVKLVYFTDPICSSCWGIEPQLRKLKLEYGEHIDIEYRMGGLLPDWNYNSGGISKPSDVAHHWDEVSVYYDMPIDGDLWLEDPLSSSYPPSIAFKAAELQGNDKAVLFMREMREMMFLKKKNLAKWEHMETAAKAVGLDIVQLKADFEGKAKSLFEQDLALAQTYGVKGFPTIFVQDSEGNSEVVYGSKPYALYEAAILKVNGTIEKSEYSKQWDKLFAKYASLTAKEFSVLSGNPRAESEEMLNDLSASGKLDKLTTKNGAMWTLKK